MPFDSSTRNKLQKMVATCRNILTEEFTGQLQSLYGIQPTGEMADLTTLTHLDDEHHTIASLLRERTDHLADGQSTDRKAAREAIDRVIREQAFTILNRLAALRMCEERGIVQECIRNGFQSRGFQVYCTTAGSSLGNAYQRYRIFLQCLFDEISLDLGLLFDRFLPFGLLFPREPALLEVLTVLDDAELQEVWKEDEAIGWIYQYFNSKEEREAMRKASAAPRNSRELAVRNQFFTPRYVVEFLTDNTLGRIWYEMTKGGTRLKEECRYLVRRPNEIFLAEGEEAPPLDKEETAEKTQEELLKEPVYIPHRPVEDPREIRMLDPACGSMHFGLYAFDLYERIYEEAWDLYPDLMPDLREVCRTKEDFLKRVPEFILRHNIHGIDIDPRACQIAGLSLWLRVQRSYQKLGLKPAERPRITRANVVCAEPMPGEKDLLDEFISSFRGEQRIVGELVGEVWEKMQLAGGAGSLLKIEEELWGAIERIRKDWERVQRGEPVDQLHMWKRERPPKQLEMRSALRKVKGGEFWDRIEGMVLESLSDFAESAGNGKGYQRKLFAEDAAQGFAFIDLCSKKYDVVLMNPPFGRSLIVTSDFLKALYRNAYIDIYACFLTRCLDLTDNGYIGSITARSFFNAVTLERFRRDIIPRLEVLVDLGGQVLDSALVDTALAILSRPANNQICVCFSLSNSDSKQQELINLLKVLGEGKVINRPLFVGERDRFLSMPNSQLLYDLDNRQVSSGVRFGSGICDVRAGLNTFDDSRFLRLWWEVSAGDIGRKRTWTHHAKGGDFETYYGDTEVLCKWSTTGREMIQINLQKHGQPWQAQQSSAFYFQPGVSYTYRSSRGFNAKVFSSDCTFAVNGPVIQSHSFSDMYYVLAWLNSETVRSLIHAQANSNLFTPGIIKNLPWIAPTDGLLKEISLIVEGIISAKRNEYARQETELHFLPSNLIDCTSNNLRGISEAIRDLQFRVDESIIQSARIIEAKLNTLYTNLKVDWAKYGISESDHKLSDEVRIREVNAAQHILAFLTGCIYGRWDIRTVKGPSLPPKLPDPFDSLPTCPPGMLVGPDGLPAKPGSIVSEEWLRARPNAITLPPEGSVSRPTTPDEEYPLRITWSGILVDDSDGDETQAYPEDIVHRVREVLDLLWDDRAQAIEQEACEILGVTTLREYFRKPSGFFDDHLKRYSKSRRKAPIYWPLSTESGSYILWIYYHRLTDQTLFQCVIDYVNPKLGTATQDIEKLRAQVLQGGTAKQRDQLERLQKLQQELTDFRDELLRVAQLPYRPNLNDGVLITASPLYKLFRLPRWRKDMEECWKKLQAGEYDWAHLAYSIWPERVREKCKTDHSIAIAHELEELHQEPEPKKKKQGGRKKNR